MLKRRIIPFLLLFEGSLVKTKRYKFSQYIGDPINTVRIFNECEVDEIALINIENKKDSFQNNTNLIKDFASECFIPCTYGGSIKNINEAETVFRSGFEKIIINTAAYQNPKFITELSKTFGSQAIIVSIDIKKNRDEYSAFYNYGKNIINDKLENWILKVQDLGAGELIINDIDNEGTWNGLNKDLFIKIKKFINVPFIIHGGANSKSELESALNLGFNAIGIGNLAFFQKKNYGVLINYPKISF